MNKKTLMGCLVVFMISLSTATGYAITNGQGTFFSAVGTVSCDDAGYDCSNTFPMFTKKDDPNSRWGAAGSCTGTLIAPRVVLTAAHCFSKDINNKGPFARRGLFHIYERDHAISENRPGFEYLKKRISISGNVVFHPKQPVSVSNNIFNNNYDIALMILDEPAPVPPWPITLSETFPEKGDELTFFGYGNTGYHCRDARQGLRMLTMPIVEVIDSYGRKFLYLRDELDECKNPEFNTCFSRKTPLLGGCRGDSGGPALDRNNEIVGVFLSTSADSKEIDGENMITSHTSHFLPIAAHRQWILQHVATAFLNKKSNDCMDVAWSPSPQEGGNVHQWRCHIADNNQLYYLHYNWDGSFFIRSLYNKMCLGIEDGKDGNWASIKQQQCRMDRRQAWRKVKGRDGWFKIVSAYSSKCMDIKYGALNNGADIIQFECHDGPNMWWRETLPVRIMANDNSDKCMEVGGWQTHEGANINEWDCINGVNNNNQVWGLEAFDQAGIALPGDWHRIRSLHSGMCATAESYDFIVANSGINLAQQACGNYSDNEAQSWYLKSFVDNNNIHFYQIMNGSHQLIDIYQNQTCIDRSSPYFLFGVDNINSSSCDNIEKNRSQRWEIQYPDF